MMLNSLEKCIDGPAVDRFGHADCLAGFRRVNDHIHLHKLADVLERIYEERAGRKSGRGAQAASASFHGI